MNEDNQAKELARWLEGESGAAPPEGIDPEVLEAIYALKPAQAPPPSLTVDDILMGVTSGPLATSAPPVTAAGGAGGEVVPFPKGASVPEVNPEPTTAPANTSPLRWFAALGGAGGVGMLLAAAATFLVVFPTLNEPIDQSASLFEVSDEVEQAPAAPSAAAGDRRADTGKPVRSAALKKASEPQGASRPSPAPPQEEQARWSGSAPKVAEADPVRVARDAAEKGDIDELRRAVETIATERAGQEATRAQAEVIAELAEAKTAPQADNSPNGWDRLAGAPEDDAGDAVASLDEFDEDEEALEEEYALGQDAEVAPGEPQQQWEAEDTQIEFARQEPRGNEGGELVDQELAAGLADAPAPAKPDVVAGGRSQPRRKDRAKGEQAQAPEAEPVAAPPAATAPSSRGLAIGSSRTPVPPPGIADEPLSRSDWAGAAAAFEGAIATQGPEAALAAAQNWLRAGNPQSALAAAERGISTAPHGGIVHRWLLVSVGDAKQALGDPAGAEQAWRDAARLPPGR
jgi:hypothetical protein